MKFKRNIGLALLLLLAIPSQSAVDDFEAQLIAFNNDFGRFFRVWMGCPQHATSIDQCEGSKMIFDTSLWRPVEKKGRRLFCAE